MMKIGRAAARMFWVGGLFALAVLPQLSLADAAVDARMLGHVEAIQKFCAQAAPQSGPGVDATVKAMLGGAPAEDLKAARESDEYKQTYESTTALLGQIEPKQAAETCTGASQGPAGRRHRGTNAVRR